MADKISIDCLKPWGINFYSPILSSQILSWEIDNKSLCYQFENTYQSKMSVIGHFAIIDFELNVFTFGRNDFGQLGIGNFEDQNSPIKIKSLPQIVSTSSGEDFRLFLDDKGFVWFSGKLPFPNFESAEPVKIEQVQNICKISSGECHCLLLNDNGDVFSFGSNVYGQLGRGGSGNLPMKIENLPKIKDVCCGSFHSILIDFDGNCFSVGINSRGELGIGDRNGSLRPTKLENLPPIRSASCGYSHTILIDENGNAYGFGYNYFNQLGFSSLKKHILTPTKINGITGAKKAYCGGNSTIIKDLDGNFWTFGGNGYGKLGLGHKNDVKVPTKITSLANVHSIICQKYSNIFIDTNGECFASGTINGRTVPIKIEHPIEALVVKPKRFNNTKNARNS